MTRNRDVATQGGLVLLNTTAFSAVTSVSIDNVFSSTYQNYRLVFNMTDASGNNAEIWWYGRTSGVDVTTNYAFQMTYSRSTTVASLAGSVGFIGNIQTGGTGTSQYEVFLANPQIAAETVTNGVVYSQVQSGGPYLWTVASRQISSSQFDGIKFYTSSGTMTGTVRIYGVRN